jgi:WD40 repeat protein
MMLSLRVLGIALLTVICWACGEDGRPPLTEIDPPPDALALDHYACWSGIHDIVAYAHGKYAPDSPDTSAIYLINPDGTDRRMLLQASFVNGLDWSPDGQSLVASVGSELWKISYPEGIVDTLLTNGQYYFPSWSPDGSAISYAHHLGPDRGIYVVDSTGLGRQLIIPYGHNPIWGYIDSLAYINFDTTFPSGALCMANLINNEKRLILDITDFFVPGSLSPDVFAPANKVVMEAQIPGEIPGIWKLELANESSGQILLFARAGYPDFSPDGNRVVFTRRGRPYANLWIINWDGTGLQELTESLFE